jgi:type I restriction enzyme S subunit
MVDLRTVRIGDLGRVITGKTPPSARPELFGEDSPFLTPTDIDGQRRYIEPERFLSPEGRVPAEILVAVEDCLCRVHRGYDW